MIGIAQPPRSLGQIFWTLGWFYSFLGYWDSFIVFWDMIKTSFRDIGKSFRDFGTSFWHLWTKSQESGQAKKSSQGLVRDVCPARFFLF